MVIGWPYIGEPLSEVQTPFWGHLGPFWAVLAPLGPILASTDPIWAIFSGNVAANRRHPGDGGPNLVGRSALGRGPFGLSLGPQAIGIPEISNEAHLLVAVAE